MYIESVPNRHSPPAVLLREFYREAGKVKKRTLANLSKWPPSLVEGLRRLLKGGTAVARLDEAVEIVRSLPHGHVAAVLGMMRQLKLDCLIDGVDSLVRRRVLALIVHPDSKRATARGLAEATACDSLAETLGLGPCDEEDLYDAMDWLGTRQGVIEQRLAKRHLKEGTLVLYDLTSVYVEGKGCPLAKYGYSRDGKRGKLQIEFGLLCDDDGRPLAVEVFGGMLTEARIREDVKPSGLDWISALRKPAIRSLVESGQIQTSLFDERDLLEIQSPDYPGERLMVCRNPLLAAEQGRKREALLQATEVRLDQIVEATRREKRRLQGQDRIALRVGKVIDRYNMAKHFALDITDPSFGYHRKAESIAAEAALDGLYVVRTSVEKETLDAEATVSAYKRLSRVDRAFRSLKTVDLTVRPIYHYNAERVRAHVFLCLLAYYVEWHLRAKLAPLLFEDEDKAQAEALRTSVVALADTTAARSLPIAGGSSGVYPVTIPLFFNLSEKSMGYDGNTLEVQLFSFS